MKTIIKATAPTIYQFNSLTAFGMGYEKKMGGSFEASMEFESEEDAKEYLRGRADKYNDEDPGGSEERLADMYADIEYGYLRIDAVKARIEEIEEEV